MGKSKLELSETCKKYGKKLAKLFQRWLFHSLLSWYSSDVGRKYVYLRNCNGLIARYKIKTGEITV